MSWLESFLWPPHGLFMATTIRSDLDTLHPTLRQRLEKSGFLDARICELSARLLDREALFAANRLEGHVDAPTAAELPRAQ